VFKISFDACVNKKDTEQEAYLENMTEVYRLRKKKKEKVVPGKDKTISLC